MTGLSAKGGCLLAPLSYVFGHFR